MSINIYSTKQYFEQNLTVKKMFEHFASENNGVGIELTKFKRILKNFDIKFHKPKNDQCSMCTKYKNSSKEADITGEFMEHITRIQLELRKTQTNSVLKMTQSSWQ